MDDTTSDDLAADDPGSDPKIEWATGMLARADQLLKEERVEEAIAAVDDVVTSLGDDQRPHVVRIVIAALDKKFYVPGGLDDDEEILCLERLVTCLDRLVAAYDQLVSTVGLTNCLDAFGDVMEDLYNKAQTLHALDRRAEELAVRNEIVIRYDQVAVAVDAPALATGRDRAVNALSIFCLFRRDQIDVDLSVFRELLDRVGSDLRVEARNYVARGMAQKAALLHHADRYQEQIEVQDEVVALFGDAPEPVLRERVAEVLLYKATTLDGTLGRTDDALAVYDEIVARFGTADDLKLYGNDVDVSIGDMVVEALVKKGRVLSDKLDRIEDALAAFDDVVARYLHQATTDADGRAVQVPPTPRGTT